MDEKHTPAPWTIYEKRAEEYYFDNQHYNIDDGVAYGIENHANAHLIAAAPDLLSALEAVANGMMMEQGFIPNFIGQAINKAKGKDQIK